MEVPVFSEENRRLKEKLEEEMKENRACKEESESRLILYLLTCNWLS